jgi:hypothetical protein
VPRILILNSAGAEFAVDRVSRRGHVVAEVVTLSEIDGIYAIACTGDGRDQCPADLEAGDTWSNFEDCVQAAITHIHNHEEWS